MSILPKKIYSLFKSWFNFLSIICKSQMKGKIYYISPSIYFLVFSPYYYHRAMHGEREREREKIIAINQQFDSNDLTNFKLHLGRFNKHFFHRFQYFH